MTIAFSTKVELLTEENYDQTFLRFQERQAGISLVFDPIQEQFFYNAYCVECKLLKELLSSEFEFLEDALEFINEEFKSWELVHYEDKKSCSDCAAK